MTHLADRPAQTPNREQRLRQDARPVGERAVRGVVSVADTKTRQPNASERLIAGTRGAVMDRIRAVQSAEVEPQEPIERIRRAYLLQSRRLRGEKDELTGGKVVNIEQLNTAELASEQVAQVILFSPMAADADKEDNTWQLSRFNDMLAAAAVSVSPSVLPNLKSVLEGEIKQFNGKVAGRNYDISAQIGRRLRGVEAEIAAARGLKTNPDLDVSMPETKGDLEGKDITVKHGGTTLHADVKRKVAFEKKLLDLIQDGTLTAEEAGWGRADGYAAVRQDEKGDWIYLVDADALGKISNLEYDQKGVTKTLELAQKMLSEVEQIQQ